MDLMKKDRLYTVKNARRISGRLDAKSIRPKTKGWFYNPGWKKPRVDQLKGSDFSEACTGRC
jgi:hypothetical protein